MKIARQRLSVLQAQEAENYRKGKIQDHELEKSISEITMFLDDLVHERERGVIYSLYILLESDTKKGLIDLHKKLQDITSTMDVTLNTYTFGQKELFKNFMPFNTDVVKENRVLQSSAAAYLMPFVTKQFNDPQGIFFGINWFNGNLIILDPFTTRNNNINIFGVSGSGKSVTSKSLLNRMYMRGIQTIVIDPEGEYVDLASQLGGEIISFSRNNGINPFFVGSSDESVILDHISMLKTFFKFFIPTHAYNGALLDEKLIQLYSQKAKPTFKNFMKLFKDEEMKEYLNVLCKGSLKGIFDSERELELTNDLIVFDMREIKDDDRRPPAMYLLTSLIWNLVNSKDDKKRMLFIDEAHELLKTIELAQFYQSLVKKARKRNLGIVSITQDVEDFLNNDFGKAIITNSETKILLKQSHSTISLLKSIFPLTDEELQMLSTLKKGEFVLFREEEHIRAYMQLLSYEYTLTLPKKNREDETG